jgi:hypothetical protein
MLTTRLGRNKRRAEVKRIVTMFIVQCPGACLLTTLGDNTRDQSKELSTEMSVFYRVVSSRREKITKNGVE